jgi:hypothetical protein
MIDSAKEDTFVENKHESNMYCGCGCYECIWISVVIVERIWQCEIYSVASNSNNSSS